jgi:hypothetical protein
MGDQDDFRDVQGLIFDLANHSSGWKYYPRIFIGRRSSRPSNQKSKVSSMITRLFRIPQWPNRNVSFLVQVPAVRDCVFWLTCGFGRHYRDPSLRLTLKKCGPALGPSCGRRSRSSAAPRFKDLKWYQANR